MKTFYVNWKPETFAWDTLPQDIDRLHRTGELLDTWKFMSVRQVSPGDALFVMKFGDTRLFPQKGIIGSGHVVSEPYQKVVRDKIKWVIDMRYEVLLNPLTQPLLPFEALFEAFPFLKYSHFQGSGKPFPQALDLSRLNALWERHVARVYEF